MSVLAELRQRTGPWHRRLEADLPLLEPNADEQTYRLYLARLFGFHAPIERELALVRGPELAALELEARRKAPALAADLAALGVDAACVPWCAFTPPVSDVPSALGCLYVLEGATLGGRVLDRELESRLPSSLCLASRYLRVYGTETRARWQRFTDVLASISPATPAAEALCDSACATFATLYHWLMDRPATNGERRPEGALEHD